MLAFTVNTVLFFALELLVYGIYWVYILGCQGLFVFLLFILRLHWELHKMKILASLDKGGRLTIGITVY